MLCSVLVLWNLLTCGVFHLIMYSLWLGQVGGFGANVLRQALGAVSFGSLWRTTGSVTRVFSASFMPPPQNQESVRFDLKKSTLFHFAVGFVDWISFCVPCASLPQRISVRLKPGHWAKIQHLLLAGETLWDPGENNWQTKRFNLNDFRNHSR